MSDENSSTKAGGIGLSGLVFLVFLVMKLAEIGVVASWPWLWVTAPLWIPLLVVLVVVLVGFLFIAVAS